MQAERSNAIPRPCIRVARPSLASPSRGGSKFPIRAPTDRRRVVLLARDRVVIARSVAGVFMHIAMTPNAYRGVVLRLNALQDDVFHYEIRLAHRDPDLSRHLHEASDDSEIRPNGGSGRGSSACRRWSNAKKDAPSRKAAHWARSPTPRCGRAGAARR